MRVQRCGRRRWRNRAADPTVSRRSLQDSDFLTLDLTVDTFTPNQRRSSAGLSPVLKLQQTRQWNWNTGRPSGGNGDPGLLVRRDSGEARRLGRRPQSLGSSPVDRSIQGRRNPSGRGNLQRSQGYGTWLASRCLPAADVLPAAMALAREVAVNTAPLSVAASKELLWSSFELPRRRVGEEETRHHEKLMDHEDAREGVRPFWNDVIPTGPESFGHGRKDENGINRCGARIGLGATGPCCYGSNYWTGAGDGRCASWCRDAGRSGRPG